MNKYMQAARENVDRHIGDCITADTLEDTEEGRAEFYDNVWVLAFDGAKDAGAGMQESRAIANIVKLEY